MNAIAVSQVYKSFGTIQAVDDVSFSVGTGEIFGLLGPNGAGKTTIIRLILDLFKPDQGEVSILGGPMTEAKKNRVGYMPEERGLYQDDTLESILVYLASLKGIPASEAHRRTEDYLVRFDLAAFKKRKVKELSKGMQQKAQIIATLLHRPELIIIDEPFSGLDPINTQMVKDLLLDLHRQGATIVMSTHQMHQVEELCERILLINHGRLVLYGDLDEIRRGHAGHALLVRVAGELPPLAGVETIAAHNNTQRLNLAPQTDPQDVLRQLLAQDIAVEQFEIATPTLDEIFIQVVQETPADS